MVNLISIKKNVLTGQCKIYFLTKKCITDFCLLIKNKTF